MVFTNEKSIDFSLHTFIWFFRFLLKVMPRTQIYRTITEIESRQLGLAEKLFDFEHRLLHVSHIYSGLSHLSETNTNCSHLSHISSHHMNHFIHSFFNELFISCLTPSKYIAYQSSPKHLRVWQITYIAHHSHNYSVIIKDRHPHRHHHRDRLLLKEDQIILIILRRRANPYTLSRAQISEKAEDCCAGRLLLLQKYL